MRVVFFGATELGYQCCWQLLELGQGIEVVGMVSMPQEFRISYSATPVRNVTFRSLEELARQARVPLVSVTPPLTQPAYLKTLQAWRPDFGLVAGWYYHLPRTMRAVFPLGVAGLHASLLPAYRGGAPLVWAIINGETQTGVTFFYLADGVDDGDVIAQAPVPIALEDDIGDVLERATRAAVQLVRNYVPRIAAAQAPRVPQDARAATMMPQRRPKDGEIHWETRSAVQVYNWIRAQTRPYPGAFTYLGEEPIILWKALLAPDATSLVTPGAAVFPIADAPGTFGVGCADGRMVLVHEVGLTDGTAMRGHEFAATRAFRPSTRLESRCEVTPSP